MFVLSLALQLRNAILAVDGNVRSDNIVLLQVPIVILSYVRLLNHNTVDDISQLVISIPSPAVYVGNVDGSTLISIHSAGVTGQAVKLHTVAA